jgi:hypothetical protein
MRIYPGMKVLVRNVLIDLVLSAKEAPGDCIRELL